MDLRFETANQIKNVEEEMMKKFLALLLSIIMCLTLIPVVSAESDNGMTAAERAAKIEELLDFTSRFNAMAKKYEIADAKKNADTEPYANARIIVKSVEEPDYTGSVAHVSGHNDWHVIQYASVEEAKKAAEVYEKQKGVEYVAPDTIMSIFQTPGEDSFLSWGYGDDHVNAFNYNEWLLGEVGSVNNLPEVVVAVVDTGCDSDHEFLAGRLVAGYDFENNDADPEDDHYHGTHVAGTVLDGTLPNVKVMPLKALDSEGYGDTVNIAAAMEYAYLNGADAVNLSLRGPCNEQGHPVYTEVIENGSDAGTVYCVASGNDSGNAMNYCPGNVERAITVAAHDSSKAMAYFSNTGTCVDITAPGVNIRSAAKGGGYRNLDGTSMATPHVAGVAAMLKSFNKNMTPDAVCEAIKGNASAPVLAGGGAGLLCVRDILKFASLNSESTERILNFFSAGQYPWSCEDGIAASGNAGVDNSTSTLSANASLGANQRITFNYRVSAAQGDKLRFCVDGEVIFETNGNAEGLFDGIIPGCGEKLLTWEFVKDASGAQGDDKAYISNVAVFGTLDSAVNAEGSAVQFENDALYPWVIDEEGNGAKSGNAGVNNSVSTLKANVELQQNMSVRFDYRVDAGAGDTFRLVINGETVLSETSTNGFVTYEYYAPQDGTFEVRFEFVKDASGAQGEDRAWVKNVKIGHTLGSALNVEGGRLVFDSNGQYPWVCAGDYAKSSNEGVSNSSSAVTLTVQMQAGDTLSFDYKVSSESNYDKLKFAVNGTEQFAKSGELNWDSYTYTAAQAGSYTFSWTYTKDGSVDRNDDCAYLDNVRLTSSSTPATGDIDGDGSVTITDAVLAMRYAMGLIPETGLNLEAGDVNGDGEISVVDATMIMRSALGLA